jgi:transketolase
MRLGHHCGSVLAEIAKVDPTIWVLDGDLADSDGAEPFASAHADRFLMAGIAEQSMVSVAAGMAACGLRPWVFSFAAFLVYRALDQIRVSLAQTGLPATLVGSHAGGCGERNGKTHQAVSDISAIAGLPGIEIWSPCDSASVRHAIRTVLARGRPAYVRLPRVVVPDLSGDQTDVVGLCRGGDVSLVATGLATHWALAVHRLLAATGIEATVVQITRLVPFPTVELNALLPLHCPTFTIEDHLPHGGLHTLLTSVGERRDAEAISWPLAWRGGSGASDDLLADAELDAASIAQKISKHVQHS